MPIFGKLLAEILAPAIKSRPKAMAFVVMKPYQLPQEPLNLNILHVGLMSDDE
jgi:hypothetical protein